jgi:hypothetical protein
VKNRQYSGALVGLGFDPETQKPLLTENDIEDTFEARFTNEDIRSVNKQQKKQTS